MRRGTRAARWSNSYEPVEQMQGDLDLDRYLQHYNHERPHQGRMMEDRTPAQMFAAGIIEQSDVPMPEAA